MPFSGIGYCDRYDAPPKPPGVNQGRGRGVTKAPVKKRRKR